jgi:hypothetical protein
MERFRIRVRNEPKRGHIWELHLFPQHPRQQLRESDARIMGSSSNPEIVLWLRKLAEPSLLRAEEPAPIAADSFGPGVEPRWLRLEDGMRLAMAFACARYLVKAEDRRKFASGLRALPSEVILYWFTLCFYGYRQAAGRIALRTLLTHEEPDERSPSLEQRKKAAGKRQQAVQQSLDLNEEHDKTLREDLGKYTARVREDALNAV